LEKNKSYALVSAQGLKKQRNRLSEANKHGDIMAKVIVYSTSTCPYCVMAKDWLKQKKVDFVEINVGIDQEKAREMVQKSGQTGVPVIDVDGEIVKGFVRPELEKALKKKKLI